MTAGLAAGVGAEVGPFEFAVGALADIKSTISDTAAKTSKSLMAELHRQPLHLPFGTSYPGAASPPSPLSLIIPHFPATGRMWYVTRFAITGSDGHTAVSGAVADIYMGPGQGNVDPLSQVYSGLVIPTIIEEGRYHNPMHSNGRVYAVIYNLPANQPITISVLAAEYPVAASESMSI